MSSVVSAAARSFLRATERLRWSEHGAQAHVVGARPGSGRPVSLEMAERMSSRYMAESGNVMATAI
jgi:hypothetical protein